VGFGRTLNHPSKGGSAMVVQTWERGSLVRKQVERFSDEFRGTFGVQTIARYVHESLADLEGARVKEYVPIFVERSAHSQGAIMKDRPEVLFVCVHNAGRSQMAAALTQQLSGGRVHVRSAGSEPAGRINLAVIEVMDELGLDLLQEFPEPLTDEVVKAADVVITMGCGDACPLYPGKRYEDWELDDPAGQPVEKVRQIREAIRGHVEQLLDELGVPIQR
jgi:protein-tyrosine-phosphatase